MKNNQSLRYILLVLLALTALLPASAKKKNANNVRLLYWNIQNGMWDGQKDNYTRFVEWVKDKDPDICVWCEAEDHILTDGSKSTPVKGRYFPAGWMEVMPRYGHKYMFVSGRRDSFPQVITSKYPIDTLGQFLGEKPDSVVQHGAGWARIVIDGKEINIITLHLQPFSYWRGLPTPEMKEESKKNYGGEKYRRMEVQWILNHTVRTHQHPEKELWMMMGDFNARSRKDNFRYKWSDASQNFLTHNYIEDTAPYLYDVIAEMYPETFVPSTYEQSRVDYVYVTRSLLKAISKAETVRDSYTKPVFTGIKNFYIPSDHLPIIVDFNLNKVK